MWDQGAVETVGAFGTLLILFMLALTFALRIVGLGRGAYIQRAN
jgi:hypothetical protein